MYTYAILRPSFYYLFFVFILRTMTAISATTVINKSIMIIRRRHRQRPYGPLNFSDQTARSYIIILCIVYIASRRRQSIKWMDGDSGLPTRCCMTVKCLFYSLVCRWPFTGFERERVEIASESFTVRACI